MCLLIVSWVFPVLWLGCGVGGIAFSLLSLTSLARSILRPILGYENFLVSGFSDVFFVLNLIAYASIFGALMILPVDGVPGSIDITNLGSAALEAAPEWTKVKNNLRKSGIGSVLFGVIAIAVGIDMLKNSTSNIAVIFIGIFMAIEGIWLLVAPHASGLIADGIMVCLVGIFNIGITVENISKGVDIQSGFFALLGGLQIIWGIREMMRYGRLKRTLRQPRDSVL